ncbi:MAG: hypothetical protein ACNFW9_00085 [Candidatus Kerfeldbacteria bacterium]
MENRENNFHQNANENSETSTNELQIFINSPELDLPIHRRDISKPENTKWLLRNILIRNSEHVTEKHIESLKELI